MADSYFNLVDTTKRFFYLQGLTADDFYTDSGRIADLEWLLYQELKQNGYERIIFYDRDWKLYCYDENSYDLMIYGKKGNPNRHTPKDPGTEQKKQTGTSTKKGLKSGKWGKKKSALQPNADKKDPENVVKNLHRVKMKPMGNDRLSGGLQDDEMAYRQIDACMMDDTIKSAIIINDADDFIHTFGQSQGHSFHNFVKLPAKNTNIMIFIFPDESMISPSRLFKKLQETQSQQNQEQNDQMEFIKENANLVTITDSNALEIRNMLNYFRLREGLKINLRHMDDITLEIRRCMAEKKVHNKQLYHYLKNFVKTGEVLTKDNCFKVIEGKKHLTAEEQLNNLIGMQNVKKELLKFKGKKATNEEKLRFLTSSRIKPDIFVPNEEQMIHVVLTGNPGTGKTTVANLIGQLYFEMGYLESGHVVETDRQGLVGGYIGQTAIKTRQKVMEAMGGVLFVDEAYTLKRTSKEEGDNRDFGQEAIDTLVKAMDEFKGKFIVVAAGYAEDMENFMNSNPGLKRRFSVTLNLEDYEPNEMKQILKLYIAKKKCRFSDEFEAKLDDFCQNWVDMAGDGWGNAGEAVNLSDTLELAWENDPQRKIIEEDGQSWHLLEVRHLPVQFAEYLKPVSELRGQVMEQLNQLTGLAGVKEQIERIRLKMITHTLQAPGHYLFLGNPGTGKTTVARLMGRILRNHGLLKRGHVKEYTAQQLIQEVTKPGRSFEFVANQALDGVLFIDEAYQLVNHPVGRNILDGMLPYMENHSDRITIIAAGYEENMEEFLNYNIGLTSRFTNTILFDDYSGAELCEILINRLKAEGFNPDEEYREYSLRALTRYMQKQTKGAHFGNARYIRTEYIPHSIDAWNKRLYTEYGENIPDEVLRAKRLTGADIPEELQKFTKEKLPKPDTRTAIEKIEGLVGFENIKKELRAILNSAKYRKEDGSGAALVPERLHWVLKGNPGTGKTMIANLLGQVYKESGILRKGHTVKVTRQNLIAEYVGQTAPKTRRMIDKSMEGILFIDEAYSLVKGEGQDGSFGAECIAELVEAMETRNGDFAVVAAGYPSDMDEFLKSNDGLASRFKVFTIDDYTPDQLYQIFLSKCRAGHFELEPKLDEKMSMFFDNYKNRESKLRVWGNGREAQNLFGAMFQLWTENPVSQTDENGTVHRIFTEKHIPDNLRRYLKGKPKKSEKQKSAMEQIDTLIGFDEVKTKLRDLLRLAEISREQDREELLDDLNFHWVLQGNPGTGKTTVAKLIGAVYKEMGLLSRGHCVKVTRTDLVAGYVGQTAIKTKECIDRAMGGILFIDEAYTLSRRSDGGSDYGQESIDTILEAMSDKKGEFAVIVAGYPREMHQFVQSNPGLASRFENIFTLPDYTADELVKILELKCRSKKGVIAEDLMNALPDMFNNMIKARLEGWANGREAERLEMKLRNNWAKNPISKTLEDETKVSVYDLSHLPEDYRKYLSENVSGKKTSSGKKEDEKVTENVYRIPFGALPALAENYDFSRDFEKQQEGLVLIRGVDDKKRVGYGSGFMMTPDGYIMTCKHVVDGFSSLRVRLRVKGRTDGDISWHNARVVRVSEGRDIALIKIDVFGYPTLSMRVADQEIRVGEDIYLMGYPFGAKLSDKIDELEPSLFQGAVSSIQKSKGDRRVTANMEAKRGCSGGPVLSKKDGAVIGILCGSITEGDQKLMEEINYILPVEYIWEEMVDNKVK